ALRRYHREWKFTVDTTRPDMEIQNPAPDSAVSAETISIQGRCEPEATISVLDGDKVTQSVPVDAKGKFLVELKLAAGWNEISLRSQDRAGNLSGKKLRIFGDREAPTARLELEDGKDEPMKADGAVLAHSKARLIVNASDDGGLAECKLIVDG